MAGRTESCEQDTHLEIAARCRQCITGQGLSSYVARLRMPVSWNDIDQAIVFGRPLSGLLIECFLLYYFSIPLAYEGWSADNVRHCGQR
jgi:hypothetical protein